LIKFGALEELNVVFVSGLRRDVLNAIGVLNRADREVSQVLIEALVVELDITAAVELGSRLSDGASGNFSGITFSPGDVGGNIGFSFLEGASNFVQFTALINLLISQDKAQVLSRPYLSARSSQEAVVEIANDRTIRIDQTFEGAAIASTDTITAGVRLQVKPTVLADEQIRIDLQVEESQFVPTLGVALVEKDRNSAQTAVTVRSGQTIVVGGLNLRRIISLNSGIPWLRRIPLLNLLTAQQGSFDQSKEVVVYLTPYIWDPGVDTPLARSGAFGPQGEIFTDFERFKVITPEEDTEHE
jgi:general secretion pathway protein D